MSKRKDKELEDLEATETIFEKFIEFFKIICRCGEKITFIQGQQDKNCPNCGNNVKNNK